MRPRHCETRVKAIACVFTVSHVWHSFLYAQSRAGTWFYLIKWSVSLYKEEIMTARNDCFVLQKLECGTITNSIPGPGLLYLCLFLESLFQWIASGWWSPTSRFVLQSSLRWQQNCLPLPCAAFCEVFPLKIALQSSFSQKIIHWHCNPYRNSLGF